MNNDIPNGGPALIWSNTLAEVWCGDCLDSEQVAIMMNDRKANLLCFDAPYSKRTTSGHENGKPTVDSVSRYARRTTDTTRIRERNYAARKAAIGESGRRSLAYLMWTPNDIRKFCDIWCPLTEGWIVTITDDVLAPAWRTSFVRHGFYPFAPIPLVETGSRVRMAGDGPSGWTCWLVVARPRGKPWSSWGTLPGAYVVPGERGIDLRDKIERVVGGKPLLAMQCIVNDYSHRGDIVVDPTCGGGTTLRATIAQGRHAIGLEQDRGRAELSAKACAAVNIGQREMFSGVGL